MFKKIIYLLLGLSLPLSAKEITQFDDIQSKLLIGQPLSFVTNIERCQIEDHNAFKIPHSTIIVKASTSLVHKDKMIAFDGEKFAASHPPEFNYNLMQRVSSILYADGKLDQKIEFFDADRNIKSPDLDEVSVTCQLGEGLHVYY